MAFGHCPGTHLTPPDSASIGINVSKNDQVQGPSRLIIDKLRFDGFAGVNEPAPVLGFDENEKAQKMTPVPQK